MGIAASDRRVTHEATCTGTAIARFGNVAELKDPSGGGLVVIVKRVVNGV